ncbi:hypothetical protein DPMN_130378 [Dreissena polymorpha]|uniref:DDE Tnp4 domain-containing protein n=1 Tax=Dreissena polymorpha TaxID=45954 RepID=A0A9D4H6N7_DREPO|nr:hypothetical protein DPMN_130378 [Dreissena polymorpha]
MSLPTIAANLTRIAGGFRDRWNFPHTLGAIDGIHIACKYPPRSGSTFLTTRSTSAMSCYLWILTTSSSGLTLEAVVLHPMRSYGTSLT